MKKLLLSLLTFPIFIIAENSGQEVSKENRIPGTCEYIPKQFFESLCSKMMRDQEKLKEQIGVSYQYPAQLIIPEIRHCYASYIEQRDKALVETIQMNAECSVQMYGVPHSLFMLFYDEKSPVILRDQGTEFTHTLHFEALCVANELMKVQEHNRIMPRVNEFVKIAIEYNRIGHVDVAMMLLDFCWAVLDVVTCMKMKIERQDNQDPIAMHLARVIFGHYGIRVKPVKKVNNEAELLRAKLVMIHEIITEKLQAIPTRNLVQTGSFANEYQLMSRLLQEVDLFYEMIMRSLGFEK